MDKTPNYINPESKRKPVSREELLKILHEHAGRIDARRRAQNQALSEALRSGIYCTGGRSDIKPLL